MGALKRYRGVRGATVAALLAAALSGCVTVHGETATVPAADRAEAKKALAKFTAANNRANSRLDTDLNATIETGALGAIDQAGLRARKGAGQDRSDAYKPLRLTDARFLIPEQAGWPKFFVADTKSNRQDDTRWLFVFQRNSHGAPWKASYLAVVAEKQLPRFARDADGRAKAVAPGGAGLATDPAKLGKTYTRYLEDGSGDLFAPGPFTDRTRAERDKQLKQTNVRNEYVDQPGVAPQYPTFGLRTKDGGALVFFATHHHHKQTLPRGYTPQIKDPLVKALLTGKPQQSVTFQRMAQQAVQVPAADDTEGEVEFLSRIQGLTKAKGE
ncbi:hypothetical protein [Streptomyces xiaopingdaonensis]|uniref:hypothetical protein n=1 Tax=Streptomyces xiaopingdaonensis TaxID=1565415 RepID=UPI0003034533|nr:hypothetical protein [Streptomyces xiaopingdaonensis]